MGEEEKETIRSKTPPEPDKLVDEMLTALKEIAFGKALLQPKGSQWKSTELPPVDEEPPYCPEEERPPLKKS